MSREQQESWQNFILRTVNASQLTSAVTTLINLGMPADDVRNLVNESLRLIGNVQRSGALGPKAVSEKLASEKLASEKGEPP